MAYMEDILIFKFIVFRTNLAKFKAAVVAGTGGCILDSSARMKQEHC